MSNFKLILEQIQIEYENDQILEFANMSAKMHNFGVDVKLHVMQPNKKLQHGPRVKIFKPNAEGSFTITLEENPRVIGNYKNIVSKSELNILLSKIKKYRNAFIQFWNDDGMDTNELQDLFRQIDMGFEV